MKYVEGETVELYGSTYLIEKVQHRTRVKLRKIEGVNGQEFEEFGIPDEG